MALATIEISIKDMDAVKSVFELLGDNAYDLPEPMKSRLIEASENNGFGWVHWGDLDVHIDNDNCTVTLNGAEQLYVTSYNKLLRKVGVFNPETKRIDVHEASSFSIANNGSKPYVEWNDAT